MFIKCLGLARTMSEPNLNAIIHILFLFKNLSLGHKMNIEYEG